ncbi:uncharacterized protein [Amphiura filiformis]|uniref:uncharacterized protein n=1 Tax=Amphiura filiformis TaxID=82378 RepID=UPI003B21A49D
MESGWAKICSGDYYKGFDELCSVSPLAKEALVSTAMQYLGQDMAKLLKYSKRLQRLENAQDLQSFSWEEVLHEANDLCPDLVTVIDHLLQQGKRMHGRPSASQVKRPNVAVGMVLSLLLHYQDPSSYRATQQLTSLLLHLSGCKEQLTYLSLSHLGVCLGPASTLDFVSKFRGHPGVCEIFKNTDLGTLGNNSIKLKQGCLAQKRKEKREQEELETLLKEEEMDVEEEWKEQLRQVAEEMGLDEEDTSSESDDSTDSTEYCSEEISSNEVVEEGVGDDQVDELEFYEQWKKELKEAAEAMGVDKADLLSGNSHHGNTDEDGIKDDEPDVQIIDDSSEAKQKLDEDDDEMGVETIDITQSIKLTEISMGVDQTELHPNGGSTNGNSNGSRKDWNVATNFYSKRSKPKQGVCKEVKNTGNGSAAMVDESTSPTKNARSLCAKITQIDLTPAEEDDDDDDDGGDRSKTDEGGGDEPRMEVDDVGDETGRGREDDNSMFCNSYLNNKRFSTRMPASPPKRPKANEDSMEGPR